MNSYLVPKTPRFGVANLRKSTFDVQTEVNLEILKRFNEAGLEFAFPTQTIYTLQGDAANA